MVKKIAILIISIICINCSFAITNSKNPISIKSDNVELKDKQGLAIYTKNVHAKQDNQELFADKLILKRGKNDTLKEIIAYGHPAKLTKDRDIITGDILIYNFANEILTAKSEKTQATVTIQGRK